MRILVFGATGNVGSRVAAEALRRGHEVTAAARDPARPSELPPAARRLRGDAARREDVVALGAGQDVIIGATRPAPGDERALVVMAKALLAGAAQAGARLLLVGGAGSLIVPGPSGGTVLEDPRYVPPAWLPIARACADQLEVCRAETAADWAYLSPPALLVPGERTGHYRLGLDELLLSDDGRSTISFEDLAVALIDEAERPRHRRARFTVAY